MAAYAYTTTIDQRVAAPLGDTVGVAILAGQVDITNYNATTKPEITEIAGKFKTVIAVTFAITDNGYALRWNDADDSIDAYDTGAAADAAFNETATDVDVGEASFIAVGLV